MSHYKAGMIHYKAGINEHIQHKYLHKLTVEAV